MYMWNTIEHISKNNNSSDLHSFSTNLQTKNTNMIPWMCSENANIYCSEIAGGFKSVEMSYEMFMKYSI